MTDVYYRILKETPESQIRLSVNEFHGNEYISIREYYLDFDEEWKPTNKGITVALTIPFTQELFRGLLEVLSLAEQKSIIEEYFKDILDGIYQT